MRATAVLAAAVALAACKPMVPASQPDQCLRAQIFMACLKALPAGPASTRYNDWDEVVSACESAAHYQSNRPTETIKPECRFQ